MISEEGKMEKERRQFNEIINLILDESPDKKQRTVAREVGQIFNQELDRLKTTSMNLKTQMDVRNITPTSATIGSLALVLIEELHSLYSLIGNLSILVLLPESKSEVSDEKVREMIDSTVRQRFSEELEPRIQTLGKLLEGLQVETDRRDKVLGNNK